MLYPQARYFTPNGTCKNSICWNGPWNMSALAEGSLTELRLAVWLWGSCAVSCTPWLREAEMLLWQSDSRAVAAAASTNSSRAPERKKGFGEGKKSPIIICRTCSWTSEWCRDCKSSILNVTERCHMHTAATQSGQRACGQMCHKLMCPFHNKGKFRDSQLIKKKRSFKNVRISLQVLNCCGGVF